MSPKEKIESGLAGGSCCGTESCRLLAPRQRGSSKTLVSQENFWKVFKRNKAKGWRLQVPCPSQSLEGKERGLGVSSHRLLNANPGYKRSCLIKPQRGGGRGREIEEGEREREREREGRRASVSTIGWILIALIISSGEGHQRQQV